MVPADSLLSLLHSVRHSRHNPLSQAMLVPDRLPHSGPIAKALLLAKDPIDQQVWLSRLQRPRPEHCRQCRCFRRVRPSSILLTEPAAVDLLSSISLHSFGCCSLPFYSTHEQEHWSAPSLRPSNSDLKTAMTSFPLQKGVLERIQTSPSLPARRLQTLAAMKSSPAFLKTKQVFEDDRRFALEQVHASSPRIGAAAQQGTHQPSQDIGCAQHHRPQTSAVSLGRTHSNSSADSMADSVSSYHGYAGVNYQSGEQQNLALHSNVVKVHRNVTIR